MKRILQILILIVTCLSTIQVGAQEVFKDFSFNGSGCDGSSFGNAVDKAHGMVLQDDGKIVIGGFARVEGQSYLNPAMVRFMPNGNIDNSFGNGGIATTEINLPQQTNQVRPIALQADGKILMTSYTEDDSNHVHMVVMRYLENGQPDPAFSEDGYAEIAATDSLDFTNALAIQPDGKILVAGYSDQFIGFIASLVRLTPEGIPDSTFSDDGVFTYTLSELDNIAKDVLVMPDGDILMLVEYHSETGSDIMLVRINPEGTLDQDFAGEYDVSVSSPGYLDKVAALGLTTDNHILVTGSTGSENDDPFVVRYDDTGNIDAFFGTDGMTFIPLGPGMDEARGMTLDPQGRILITGLADLPQGQRLFMARLTLAGDLDTGFSDDGIFIVENESDQVGEFIQVQTDNKIVAGGWIATGELSDTEFAVCRFGVSEVENVSETDQDENWCYSNGRTLVLTKPGLSQVTVYSATGQKVAIDFFGNELTLSTLSPGIYFVCSGGLDPFRFAISSE